MWHNSTDLLEAIHDAHGRLVRKETDAMSAHAEARLLGAATRVLAVSLEHARLTGRLIDGSSLLPGMALEGDVISAVALPAEPREVIGA